MKFIDELRLGGESIMVIPAGNYGAEIIISRPDIATMKIFNDRKRDESIVYLKTYLVDEWDKVPGAPNGLDTHVSNKAMRILKRTVNDTRKLKMVAFTVHYI